MEIAMKKLVVLTALTFGICSAAYASEEGRHHDNKGGVKITVVSIGNGSVGNHSPNTGVQSGGAFNEIGSINNNNSGKVGGFSR